MHFFHSSTFLLAAAAALPFTSAWYVVLSDHYDCTGTQHQTNGSGTRTCIRPDGVTPNFDAKTVFISSDIGPCQVFAYTDLNGQCGNPGGQWTGLNQGSIGCQTLGDNKIGKWQKISVVCP